MPTKRLSRRTVLRGALATGTALAIPLPILDTMLNDNGTAFAGGAALPKRYCTWFFGNGIIPALWNPAATGTGSAWSLTAELAAVDARQALADGRQRAQEHGRQRVTPSDGLRRFHHRGQRLEQFGRAGLDRPDRGGREQGRELPLTGDWLQRCDAQWT